MQEVHDEALDVGAIMVLVGHDHQVAVAEGFGIVVHLGSKGGRGKERLGANVGWH